MQYTGIIIFSCTDLGLHCRRVSFATQPKRDFKLSLVEEEYIPSIA